MTTTSFIVRIYRVTDEDPDRLVGQAELLDGSGECLSFVNTAELIALLSSMSLPRKKRRRVEKKELVLTELPDNSPVRVQRACNRQRRDV